MNGTGNPPVSSSGATQQSQTSTTYDFQRTDSHGHQFPADASLDYTGASDSYYNHQEDGAGSSVTGHATASYFDSRGGGRGGSSSTYYNNNDATETVHEMHLALLYLLSNPEEFKKAIHAHPPHGATTLEDWNAEYGDDEDDEESVLTSGTASATPLPFVVFADDAEVVLPQAHTASQLFGIEQVEGIELEAAAGIPALSQLFLRWLALMPGGDHLNIIDPPGLTVMRIAGGRYRVTGAHRVVWTWMNEFASFADVSGDGNTMWNDPNSSSSPTSGSERQQHHHQQQKESSATGSAKLQIEDLVSLVIVDVFETDNQGRLLSYCPTFDNRAVQKTNQTAETLRKSSSKFFSMVGKARNAVAKSQVNKRASAQFSKMGIGKYAKNVAENVIHRVDEAVHNLNSPNRKQPPKESDNVTDIQGFEDAITEAAEEAASSAPNAKSSTNTAPTNDSSKPASAEEQPSPPPQKINSGDNQSSEKVEI